MFVIRAGATFKGLVWSQPVESNVDNVLDIQEDFLQSCSFHSGRRHMSVSNGSRGSRARGRLSSVASRTPRRGAAEMSSGYRDCIMHRTRLSISLSVCLSVHPLHVPNPMGSIHLRFVLLSILL